MPAKILPFRLPRPQPVTTFSVPPTSEPPIEPLPPEFQPLVTPKESRVG